MGEPRGDEFVDERRDKGANGPSEAGAGGTDVLDAARGAASGAAETFMSGLTAVRSVHEAARRHAGARGTLRAMLDALEEEERVLARREEVEGSYDEIVREQSQVAREAGEKVEAMRSRVDELEGEAASASKELELMRESHEREQRPYRRLAEGARGRLDDATRVVAEARRAVKTAEGQVRSATDRREQSIAAANRAVDSSQARLRRAQDELSRTREGGGSAFAQLQNEVAAELAHVESARAEVGVATREAQAAVDAAQTHLWTQKKSLESAQREAEEARREYEAHRQEYEAMVERDRAEERSLEERIAELRTRADEAKADHDEAAERHDQAQALLDEAEDVHATPEETERLRGSVEGKRLEVSRQEGVVEGLAQAERDLRARTRRERVVFGAVIVLALALLVLAAVLLAAR